MSAENKGTVKTYNIMEWRPGGACPIEILHDKEQAEKRLEELRKEGKCVHIKYF